MRGAAWAEAAVVARLAATACIARVVRCPLCGDLAFEEARERLTDDEIAVRYDCPPCRWQQTRHFFVPKAADSAEV
jgi:hypothetical protein